MRMGAFEIEEPLPNLVKPHAFSILRPWIDAGDVGTLTLEKLERHFGAKPLGEIVRPGVFFDFTRYRPTSTITDGRRQIEVPNTVIRYAQPSDGRGYIFLHLLEPHMFAEDYMDSILEVLKTFGVEQMIRIGSWYSGAPHTRPLVVTGLTSPSVPSQPVVEGSSYQGPTSIIYQLAERSVDFALQMTSLMVGLPHYTDLDQDYSGVARVLDVLRPIYGLPEDLDDKHLGQTQYDEVSQRVAEDPKLRQFVEQLEAEYDRNRVDQTRTESQTALPPAIVEFLKDMEDGFETR